MQNQMVFHRTSNTTGVLVYYEVCNPVEGYYPSYLIDSVAVSNFITPGWFDSFTGGTASNGPWDYLGILTAPLQVALGGYVSTFTVTAGSGWQSLPKHW